MISFFNKHKKIIFIATTGIFLGGIFVGLGAYLIGDSSAATSIAKVGKQNIPYSKFTGNYYKYTEMMQKDGTELTEEKQKEIKMQLLQEMVAQEVFVQSAREYGIQVSDYELMNYISSVPYFQHKGKFNKEIYQRALTHYFRMKPKDFEKEQRYIMLSDKFRKLLFSACKLTPAETAQIDELAASLKGFEKQKGAFLERMKNIRFLALANYQLSLFTKEKGITNYLEIREQVN